MADNSHRPVNDPTLLAFANAGKKPRTDRRFAKDLAKPLPDAETSGESRTLANPILAGIRGFTVQIALFSDGSVQVRALALTNPREAYGADEPALTGVAWETLGRACEPLGEPVAERAMLIETQDGMWLFVGEWDVFRKGFIEVWAGFRLRRLTLAETRDAVATIAVSAQMMMESYQYMMAMRRRCRPGARRSAKDPSSKRGIKGLRLIQELISEDSDEDPDEGSDAGSGEGSGEGSDAGSGEGSGEGIDLAEGTGEDSSQLSELLGL